ncbi:hypothetical protein GTG28_00525 [Vibrio sp. OCN044]|uniref:Uncharacterized protein n=1 Tax=Vibrio tetraodonis subsp. pristinus TaxID=2695891 RepID=A0A6L8LNZ1_9VIBR|nr:hypothetical protein [Vibrio tetraodonis]MYM57718.1 hypothetical protein [Vibrio tetraodonis subsp. pristinus]
MLPKAKIRIAIVFIWIFFFPIWVYVSSVVLDDYFDLLNNADKVQVSIITLWLPVGFLGVLLYLLCMTPRAFWLGRKINEVYQPKTIKMWNKIMLIFALLGIAFAAGWTYHSLDLLDRSGYVYSRDLTKITPTGIHLIYVKSR